MAHSPRKGRSRKRKLIHASQRGTFLHRWRIPLLVLLLLFGVWSSYWSFFYFQLAAAAMAFACIAFLAFLPGILGSREAKKGTSHYPNEAGLADSAHLHPRLHDDSPHHPPTTPPAPPHDSDHTDSGTDSTRND
jgi:hypothetical protein